MPQGGSNERYAQPTVDMFRSIIDYLGMKHVGTVLVPGVYQRGVIREKRRVLDTAYKIGLDSVDSFEEHDYDSMMHGLALNSSSESSLSDSK
ncbi:MAG: hypothetical protein P1Q69_07615 [Candidatus Thorarchaeota archaeon]|nr:hypothetical protein [Candidatus Thorarchaeota archaeon]